MMLTVSLSTTTHCRNVSAHTFPGSAVMADAGAVGPGPRPIGRSVRDGYPAMMYSKLSEPTDP